MTTEQELLDVAEQFEQDELIGLCVMEMLLVLARSLDRVEKKLDAKVS